jgi:DNA-binding cell septation regulator SpoVG
MEITDIRYYPYDGKDGFKGYCGVTFDGVLVIKGTVRMGKNGMFFAWPSKPKLDKTGKPLKTGDPKQDYDSMAFSLNSEFRSEVNQAVLDKINPGEDMSQRINQAAQGNFEPPPSQEDDLPF